jgi:dolichol-phosphate mannosyltransferase
VEIPVNHRPRQFGVSKYGLGNRAVRATLDMFGVRWLQSRRLDLAVDEVAEAVETKPLRTAP